MMDYMPARTLLHKHGISSIRSAYVSSADEAVRFAGGRRIVLKVISKNAIHKSRLGLVRADLSAEDIGEAFSGLESAARKYAPYRMLAQEMAAPGVEIIIGSRTDQQFGRIMLIGLGGIYVETFKDFALRVCPITKADALDMINQLRSRDVVTFMGEATEMIAELLIKASRLAASEMVSELDLNPVIVRKGGYDVVDIRIIR